MMKWDNILQLSNNTAIVEKAKNNTWTYCKGGSLNIKRSFKNEAQIIAQAKTDAVSLVAEKCGKDEYSIVHSRINGDYLRGLVFGAIIIDCAYEDFYSDDDKTKIYNATQRLVNNIEGELGSLGVKFNNRLIDKKSALNKVTGFYKEGLFDANDIFDMKLLESISSRIGIITPDKPDGGYNYHKKGNSSRNSEINQATSKIDAIDELVCDGCNLVSEKISDGNYQIVYSDTNKDYTKGILEAYLITNYVQKSNAMFENNQTQLIEKMMKNTVNIARKELGLKKLAKNADLTYADNDIDKPVTLAERETI